MPSSTLVKPPPVDPSKSVIENVLDLLPLNDIGPDIFTNRRPLWHPPGARGIFGGAAIAQSLAAAQQTIPPPSPANNHANFFIHSMHCYFVLAGDASIPVLYHVERVREGKSFMTRTVQARQRGKCIFTTTMSFVREGSGGKKVVQHQWPMPEGLEGYLDEVEGAEAQREKEENGEEGGGPFLSKRAEILNNTLPHPHLKRTRQWIRARGRMSPSGGSQAHLSALAYMSDSYFIGTVSRVHNLWRFSRPKPKASTSSKSTAEELGPYKHLAIMAQLEQADNRGGERPVVGMMVSMDHTIYFHEPQAIRADEWLMSEMESPWAGDGRGLVLQRIWSRSGKLVASCVQEGLVRLEQDSDARESKL